MPDAEKVAAVREALPAVAAGIYLNTPVAGPIPAESAAAMAEIADWELTTGRAGRDRTDEVLGRIDEARAAVATILALGLDEVALVHGQDDAVRRVAQATASGSALRVVHAADEAAIDELPAALERGGSLLLVDLVSPTSGALLPVARATAMARAAGVPTVVDVSLAAGAIRLDPDALGGDLVVTRTDAWLLGPEGLAVIGGRRDLLQRLVPPGDAGWGTDSTDVRDPAGLHLPSVVGLARSCGWLSMYVGLEWIEARGRGLAAAAVEHLSSIPGVTVVTPEEAMRDGRLLPDRGLARRRSSRRTGPPDLPARLQRACDRHDPDRHGVLQHDRGAGAAGRSRRARRVAHPRNPSQANAAHDAGPAVTPPPRRRGPVEIRWRQFRNAPRPIVRAVLSSLVVAVIGGLAYLAYDLAAAPDDRTRTLLGAVYVAVVLVAGALGTWLLVRQPTGAGTRVARSPWSAALGLFAAIPIAYLVLVVCFQVLRPLLAGR